MARGLLVALVNVKEGREEAFKQWYLDEHIDHTAKAPHFLSGNVYKNVAPYGNYDSPPPQYLAFYELDTDDYEVALEGLHEFGRTSGGHNPPMDGIEEIPAEFTMAGWFVFEKSTHTKG